MRAFEIRNRGGIVTELEKEKRVSQCQLSKEGMIP